MGKTFLPGIVTAAPNLTLTPNTLSFSYQIGGSTPAAKTFSVASTGAALSYNVTTTTASGGSWLSASPASGTTSGTESVSVNPTGLAAGTYTGTVSVASTGAGNSPQTVAVTLTVTAAPNLTLTPNTLSFSYQIGGSTPAAQSFSVASTGAALSYTVTTSTAAGGSWLSASPASGTTSGTESVSVNPTGLVAGTYTGTVSVASTGAGNSPQTVAVTLTVTAAPNLTLTPNTLSFSYQIGGSTPAAQSFSVASTGAALSYNVTTTTASGGSWLSASPASGTTSGTESVSVNASGLAAGTYNGTVSVASTGAGNTPQTVAVSLTVTASGPPGSGSLVANPRMLNFYFGGDGEEGSGQLSRRLYVTSIGSPLQFTAQVSGGSWLTVSPSGGATSTTLTVTVYPQGLAKGQYVGQIQLSAPGANSLNVPVTMTLAGEGGGDGGDDGAIHAEAYTYDPGNTGAVSANWVYGAGVPSNNGSDPTNQGLVLSNNASASSGARAGVILKNVAGTALSVLGFDLRDGSLCSAQGPRFVIVTSDDAVHALGSCTATNQQPPPAAGWKRYKFDPAQAYPPIATGMTVKSIALMVDDGPSAGGGMAVIDNVNINGTFIGHD